MFGAFLNPPGNWLFMKKLTLEQLQRLSETEFKRAPKLPIVLILDNIRSGLNVGSLFRTADAFRIQKIYLVGITARPPHKEILKTALGSTQTVDWEYCNDGEKLLKKLKDLGYKIISIEQADQSISLEDFFPAPMEKHAIILGNEVGGVSESLFLNSDMVIEIPQFGTKHSLNVAVCGGIVIWQMVSNSLAGLKS